MSSRQVQKRAKAPHFVSKDVGYDASTAVNANPVLREPSTSLNDEKTEMMEMPYSLPKDYGIGHVISIYIHNTGTELRHLRMSRCSSKSVAFYRRTVHKAEVRFLYGRVGIYFDIVLRYETVEGTQGKQTWRVNVQDGGSITRIRPKLA